MKRRVLLAWVLLAASAQAQQQAPCLKPGEMESQHLLGTWEVEFQGQWELATLKLVPHPEYARSFRGTLEEAGRQRLVAGDFEGGELALEQSDDGMRISAAWQGEVVPESCGREIRGTWTRDGEDKGRGFVLRRPGR